MDIRKRRRRARLTSPTTLSLGMPGYLGSFPNRPVELLAVSIKTCLRAGFIPSLFVAHRRVRLGDLIPSHCLGGTLQTTASGSSYRVPVQLVTLIYIHR